MVCYQRGLPHIVLITLRKCRIRETLNVLLWVDSTFYSFATHIIVNFNLILRFEIQFWACRKVPATQGLNIEEYFIPINITKYYQVQPDVFRRRFSSAENRRQDGQKKYLGDPIIDQKIKQIVKIILH